MFICIWLSSMDSLELAATSTGTTLPLGLMNSSLDDLDGGIREHETQGEGAVVAAALFGQHLWYRFRPGSRPCRRRDKSASFSSPPWRHRNRGVGQRHVRRRGEDLRSDQAKAQIGSE